MSTTQVLERGPRIFVTAGESLADLSVAAVVGGLAVVADKETPAHSGRVRGIVIGAVSSGATAKLQIYGPLVGSGWSWTPDLPIYLSTSGNLTQTPPLTGILQQLAVADTASRIFIDPQEVADRSNLIAVPFAWGDASPVTIGTVPAGGRVVRIELLITTAFNGTSPSITIGDAGDADRLLAADQNLPSQVATYEVHPGHLYASSTPILLTITPGGGASAGAGTILLYFQR